jgi:hypothetical protein
MAIEIGKYLTRALQRDEVIVVVVSCMRLDARPILRGLCHIPWELGFVAVSTMRTILDLGLMFGHFHLHRRKIKYLALFAADSLHIAKRGVTLATLPYPVRLDMIWVCHLLECVPFVPNLTAGLPATWLSQAPRSGLLETIAGRRFAAVIAVLGQLVLQLLNGFLQLPKGFSLLLDTLNQGAHQLHHSVLALGVNGSNFFVGRQLYGSHPVTAVECWPYYPRLFDGASYSMITVASDRHCPYYG